MTLAVAILLLIGVACNTKTKKQENMKPGKNELSNWHTHPSGQILIITDGIGYYQIEGQPIEVIKKGDVVKFPPNVRHWHGASPDVGVQQLYIIPNTEKGIVEWMEPVTDEAYNNTK